MSRIHDLDWCYSNERQLTTCSHDGSVKFWDISSPREPFNTIKAGTQKLWRAKNYVRSVNRKRSECHFIYLSSRQERQWLSY